MMSGFKNERYNCGYEHGLFNQVVRHLIEASNEMRVACSDENNPLPNHEDRITDRLVGKYLVNRHRNFRYAPQVPVNFNDDRDRFDGRADIEVVTGNRFLGNELVYFLIECKRIDGTADLNRKYITEGVARFTEHPPQYPAENGMAIMFGYVVSNGVDIADNTTKIESLQHYHLHGVTAGSFASQEEKASRYYVYNCKYTSEHLECVELKHLFYDFSEAIFAT